MLALQAHLKLAEVAGSKETLGQCPKCDHCRESWAQTQDTLSLISTEDMALQLPFMGPIHDRHSNPSTKNAEGQDLLELQSSSLGGAFYDVNLQLEEVDFETRYSEDDALSTVLFSRDVLETQSTVISPAISQAGYSSISEQVTTLTPSLTPNVGIEARQQMPGGEAIPDGQTFSRSTSIHVSSIPRKPLSQTEMGLHLAAREGFSAILSILLSTGAGVDCRDETGRTPLHQCAEIGHVEALEFLLDAGADPNSTDDNGTSVILTAVKAGKEVMVKMLVEALNAL